ncbi:MAG: c-type cytochrome [Proteobacteria bacterium]|nr:c-type cytochrome [Pseudomonadota bacterium]
MKKSYVLVLCLFALAGCNKAEEAHTVAPPITVSAGSESGNNMPLLARENNCTACHAIDHKVVGPAWIEVAKKYKGDPTAEARLIVKVSKGGAGAWGTMPMPANDAAGKKHDQIKALVQFILALAK